MLYAEGNRVQLTSKKTQLNQYEKQLKQAKEKYDKIGWPLIVKVKDKFIITNPHSGAKSGPAGTSIRNKKIVKTENGDVVWEYMKDRDGNGKPFPTHSRLGLYEYIPKEEFERAFFLLEILQVTKPGEIFELVDTKAKNRSIVESKKKEATINAIIFQGIVKEADLRKIAGALQIPRAHSEEFETVQVMLYEKVTKLEEQDGTGYDMLIHNKNITVDIELKNKINIAEDEGLIVCTETGTWNWMEDEGPGVEICKYTNIDEKYSDLISFFIDNEDVAKLLEDKVAALA